MAPPPEIRVARIIARLNVGGPAIHVTSLSARLPAPFRSRLYVGDIGPGEQEIADVAARAGGEPTRISGLGRSIRTADALALFSLVREIRRFRPHIVHTHTAKAGALGRIAARAAGVPVVVHTFHGHVFDGYFRPAVTQAFLAIERGLARLSDAIVTLSPLQQADIVTRYHVAPPAKVYVIPLGFDFRAFDDMKVHRGELRRELGLSENAPIIASVGRLTAIKDHPLLLRAFRLLQRDAHLVIVGGGEELGRLQDLARTLGVEGRTHFLGFRSDIHRILADARVVALTSINEGTPVAVIEALAAGCVPVSTAVGGVEDVLEGGRWGRLVRSREPGVFAAALEGAVDEACAQREAPLADGEAPAGRRAYARQRYGVGRLVDDHATLYRRLLHERGLF